MSVTLHHGDCLSVLADMDADDFDAIVTDPPYHLTSIVRRFGAAGSAPAQPGTDGLFQRGSKGFMGQTWDGGDIAFRPETWAALLRVTKPGGHLVAFNHSRTWAHMAVAIEAAGWEMRDSILDIYDTGPAWAGFLDSLSPDQVKALSRAIATADAPLLAWLYGCGFPKSHDVSKGIDKLRDDRESVAAVCAWVADQAEAAGITRAQVDAHMGTSDMAGWWLSRLPHRCALPTPEQWAALSALLGLPADMDAEVARLNARKGQLGENWLRADVVGHHATPAQAAEWREKFEGSAARGAGEIKAAHSAAAKEWAGWGTALKPAWEPIVLARKPLAESSIARQHMATGTGGLNIDAGRVPAHDAQLAAKFASVQNAGSRENSIYGADARDRAGAAPHDLGRWPANVVTDGSRAVTTRFPVDAEGPVSRFFYSAKADKADRAGSDHPTVKPQALMRWLIRLVTARGGHVLDPFGGSGSTGWAAHAEGRRATLIERDDKFAGHIAHRIAGLGEPPAEQDKSEPRAQDGLFDWAAE